MISIYIHAQVVDPTTTVPQTKLGTDIFVNSKHILVHTWKARRLQHLFLSHFNNCITHHKAEGKIEEAAATSTLNKGNNEATRSLMEEFSKTFFKLSIQASPQDLATSKAGNTEVTAATAPPAFTVSKASQFWEK